MVRYIKRRRQLTIERVVDCRSEYEAAGEIFNNIGETRYYKRRTV